MSIIEFHSPKDLELVESLVLDLCDPQEKANALSELRKKRGMFEDLAPMLWYSLGTMAALLQEVVLVYPTLSSPTLSANASSRVCNALGLLQTAAAHPVTRTPFLAARIPQCLYPFLDTTSKVKSYEYLRLASLNVIDALVKADDTEAFNFLVTSQVIPLCLRIMETDTELPKLVCHAIFCICPAMAHHVVNPIR
ncbi:cell differentiation protein rcd1-like isoform X1 [Panicum miliaceum]|uniref:Cell differentiation protein rcd1-like isoform X1 n=1 Tax=Panicum miliaceum TaxID=4540 RepID=A0A3L6TBL9_PANMI|nr:cell differentiation protein rcd1-like isoform X1 [Panicum miliaceum]